MWMKEYKNIDDFNSHIFNDTIDYIFDTFIFEKIEKEDDLVELLGGQSNRHLDEVLYIAYMHCKNNIATYDKTDKNGNIIKTPRFDPPPFSNKMFE